MCCLTLYIHAKYAEMSRKRNPMLTVPAIKPTVDLDRWDIGRVSLTGDSVGASVGFLSVCRGAVTETLLGTP